MAFLVLLLLAHINIHSCTDPSNVANTQKYKHNVLNVMFCGAQRAGCAHIESTYAACNSSYAHISQGRLSSHVVNIIFDKQSLSYNFNHTLLLYSLHPQLPYHPHKSNLHYHPRTWAEHQLPFGGSCARARSSQPFVWKSFLLMAIWDHRRYSREEFLNVWCLCLKWSSIFVLRLLINSSGEKDIGFSRRGWIWSVFVSFFHSFVVCV